MTATSRTPASVLQEICVHRKITPVYEIDDDNSPTNKKNFRCQVTCDNYTAVGYGRSKKEAKHDAADKMLQLIPAVNEPQLSSNASTVPSPYEGKVKEDSVGPLSEFCTEYGLKVPEYMHIRAEGPPHATMFTFRCTVGSLHAEAIERTKQQSKQLSAKYMLSRLKRIVDERTKLKLPDISFVDSSQEQDFRKANTLLNDDNSLELKKMLSANLAYPLRTDFVQFKTLFDEESECYEEIRNLICDYNEENALSALKSVLDKADFKYTLIPVESVSNVCSVILNIDCNPNLNILDSGSTYVESCHNVAVKTLKYLKLLCFAKQRQVEEAEENIDFETLINVKKKSC